MYNMILHILQNIFYVCQRSYTHYIKKMYHVNHIYCIYHTNHMYTCMIYTFMMCIHTIIINMHIYIFRAYLQGTSNSYQQNASITACVIKKVGTFQLQRGPVNFNFIFVLLNCFFGLTKASTNEQIPIPSPPQSLPFSPFFFEKRDHRTIASPPIPLSILYWPGAKLPFCLRSPGP